MKYHIILQYSFLVVDAYGESQDQDREIGKVYHRHSTGVHLASKWLPLATRDWTFYALTRAVFHFMRRVEDNEIWVQINNWIYRFWTMNKGETTFLETLVLATAPVESNLHSANQWRLTIVALGRRGLLQ